jgi:cytochrome P450
MYRGFLGGNRLYVTDPKALAHILVSKPVSLGLQDFRHILSYPTDTTFAFPPSCVDDRQYEYPKPIQTRHLLAQILGEGILFVEGDQHKLSAPFTQASTTSYYPIFHEIAEKLVSKLNTIIESQLVEEKKDPSETSDYTVINIYSYLSRATLDIIGRAGFDYDFKALDDEENELANVFQQMLQPREIKISAILITALVRWIPMLKNIPTKSTKRIKKATEVMQREGKKMLAERREQAIAGELEGKKDLLSLIVKANSETKNPKDKLHDDEVG